MRNTPLSTRITARLQQTLVCADRSPWLGASAALALCVALLSGCSSPDIDPTQGWNTERIQTEAQTEMQNGAYDKAATLYEKLEGRTAGSLVAQQAQLERAYAHYKLGEKPQAMAVLNRFIKLHPTSAALDYAFYLKGLVNFNDKLGLFAGLTDQDLTERDQVASKEAFETFRELVTRFPNSKYAADARQRMTHIVNSLAAYDVHVARYYYTREAYVASINRAQTVLTDYPGVPATEEALALMMLSYNALKMPDLSDDARRLLATNYPQSAYLNGKVPSTNRPWWRLW